MREEIISSLKGLDADYVEVRIEETESTRIQYRDMIIEDIGRTTGQGGCVRALVNGGWGFVSFNRLDDLKEKAFLAVKQARLAGKEKSFLFEMDAVTDTVESVVKKDPITVPLARKKEILDEYNDIIWAAPQIQTSSIGYSDSRKKKIFANSEGSFIVQSRPDVTIRMAAIARDGSDVQQSHLSLGSRGEFGFIETLHDQVKEMAQRASELLSAPQCKGGEYTVICDPILAGVFVHEAFGHLSESDFVYENEKMREIMVLGRKFGSSHLNIIDGAAVPGLRGSFKYDDEGTPSTKTYLIREGILSGRLHSRETASKMGEQPTGNARAISYQHEPIVRMTNTYIEPNGISFNDMIADIKEGVYARNWYGGMTSMEMFTFSAAESYMIRNGRVEELMRPVVLSGNVFSTLENIDAIGNDLDMNEGGGCGKGGQSPLPVSNGSPHIRIQNCLIGGG